MRASEAQACWRGVQRDIVKNRADPVLLKSRENLVALGLGRHEYVVHVSVVLTIRRHDRAAKQALALERREHLVVALPDRQPLGRDALRLLELGPQKGGGDLARQKRRTEILAGVFVDFAAEKPAAIGALFADDFGAKHKPGIV